MPKYKLGNIRRSHIHQSGPGAIIDFRAGEKNGGGPISVIASSIDFWPDQEIDLSQDPCVVREERLEKKLAVQHFRLPPAELNEGSKDDKNQFILTGERFPTWLLCPKCSSLKHSTQWQKEMGDPSRWCEKCSEKNIRQYVVPSRFIIVCDKGHISDFPWQWYLKTYSSKKAECIDGEESSCDLTLKSDGKTGLSGLILSCKKCSAFVNLKSIFHSSTFEHLSCKGNRPWMGDNEDNCTGKLKALQRGASNIYFPERVAALSIPPWTEDEITSKLGLFWEQFKNAQTPELQWDLINNHRPNLASISKLSNKELYNLLKDKSDYINQPERQDLEKDEYEKFAECNEDDNKDFQLKGQNINNEISGYFKRIIKVERLREVTAQTGFSRINPPVIDQTSASHNVAKISKEVHNWLPAVEVRGEGIFIILNEKAIDNWLFNNSEIEARTHEIREAYEDDCKNRAIKPSIEVNANFILLHTLAHTLLYQISFESGYNTASLKEKIYASYDKSHRMNGILLYTGSNDADGTLGGLARQASADLFFNVFDSAINKARWCSQDPLCYQGIASISESLNKAACHSCTLLPETSCQFFNRFLDRCFLVGTPDNEKFGFFSNYFGNSND